MRTKEENAAYMRQYYAEHKAELSMRAALRYEANKETVKAYIKKYKENHLEEVKDRAREYQHNNRKKCNDSRNNWIDANPLRNLLNHENEYDSKRQHIIDYAAQYAIDHPGYRAKSKKAWKEKNKEYDKVIHDTLHLVESGDIKQTPCSICGNEKVMAYHNDRVDPYNIEWLCKEHFWAKKKAFFRERKRLRLGLTE